MLNFRKLRSADSDSDWWVTSQNAYSDFTDTKSDFDLC